MSKTNDFLCAVYTRLSTLATRVYNGEEVNPATKIPYVYFTYTSTSDIEKLEDFIIEVNVIGYANKIDDLETLTDTIDGDGNFAGTPSGMNYYHYGSGGHPTFRCFRINRLNLPTGAENFARRQLRYRVRVYL